MKNAALLITFFCGLLSLNAQSSKREEGIKFGIKAGINASNFNGDVNNNKMRNGLHIGMVSEIIVNDKISIQPELLFSAQGYKNEDPAVYGKSKFDYVILPVLFKYYAMDKLSIEAGPQVGFLVNSFNRDNNGNTKIENQNVVDFGVDLGLGYEIYNGIFFQGRYNLGITNVNNNNAVKYTNSVFQLSVGVLF